MKPGALVLTSKKDGTTLYGKILYGRYSGYVCDWYYTAERRGMVFQKWVDARQVYSDVPENRI